MWVFDIRHWLNEQQDGLAAPQLRRKVKKLAEIITWITSSDRGLPAGEAPKCRRRPVRKPCKGALKIQFEIMTGFTGSALMKGINEDEGMIDGWQGLIWDMSEGTIH